MNCAVIQNMAGTLSVRDEYAMIMDRESDMKAVIYGQVRLEEILKVGRFLFHLSLSSVGSFLEHVKDAPGLFQEDVYSIFTFEPMPIVHLGISKLLKNCFVGYVGS